MEYFDAPEANPGQDGVCSDNECPCGYPGATIPRGTGYLYISKELVEFRRDARSVEQARKKLERIRASTPGMMVIFDPSVSMPILMCEQGARKRGLDMEVAAADARYWWEHHKAPLRPTPLAKEKAASAPVRPISTAADVASQTGASQPSIRPAWSPPVAPPPTWSPPVIPSAPRRPSRAWVWWLVGGLGFLILAAIFIFRFTALRIPGNRSAGSPVSAPAKVETLIVGSDFTWPPFEYIDDEGEYAGFDVELMRMIAEEIGVEVVWENLAWDSLFTKVIDGQVDLAISAIGYSETRDENMDFSIPYLEIPDVFLAKKGFSGSISAPDDLAEYQIGVALYSFQNEWLETELIPQGVVDAAQIKRYENLDNAVDGLMSGESDIVIMDKTMAVRYQEQYPELAVIYERANPDNDLYIIYPAGSDQLREEIDQVILGLKSSGAIDRLFEDVFSVDP